MSAMKKNLKYIPMALGCGVVMALVLLFLMQWTGYSMNVTNAILFCLIGLCLVKVMEVCERWQFDSSLVQLWAVILSFAICLFYSFYVSYDASGNALTEELAGWAALVHGVCMIYVLVHRKRKKAEK